MKISELPYAPYIDDRALVVLVQDHANKIVTVDDLSKKINEKQDNVINKLWHDLRHLANADTVKNITKTIANHEYRIDGIEKLNGKQDRQLVVLTDALRDTVARQDLHHRDIKRLTISQTENRKSLCKLWGKVKELSYNTSYYFNSIDDIKSQLSYLAHKHDEDIAYAIDTANAYTSTEADNLWTYTYSSYAYLNSYVHFNGDEYWGKIDNISQVYTDKWNDNNVQ